MGPMMFLFGEAEKGTFCTPIACRCLPELEETFGNPPGESLGIFYAIQALLYNRELIYYRVREEGFSVQDYMRGLQLLQDKDNFRNLSAISIPGVGDAEIIDAVIEICRMHHSLLITTEKDLYDYLMH
jgi:hypothetical protein